MAVIPSSSTCDTDILTGPAETVQIIADTIIDIAKMFTNLCLYIVVTPFSVYFGCAIDILHRADAPTSDVNFSHHYYYHYEVIVYKLCGGMRVPGYSGIEGTLVSDTMVFYGTA
ncbi:MAG: hypothetical protein C5S52_04830 [ANME-2 cluster archaeon]|nr:hypothetical protein [ANME-2 cluster archaeon]